MKFSGNKHWLLPILLILQSAAIVLYTIVVVKNSGWGVIPAFLNNLLSVSWSGQFNLDFSNYLVLSGLWIMWRNRFSVPSIFLSLIAITIGFIFFGPYLLYLIAKENGDLKRVLIGER